MPKLALKMNFRSLLGWSGLGLLKVGAFSIATAVPLEVVPYEIEILSDIGQTEAEGYSAANVAEVTVAAWGNTSTGGIGQSGLYASSESTLTIGGLTVGTEVLVDITYSMEVSAWKSPNSSEGGSIASANSVIGIADQLDDETNIWEAELDLHITDVTEFGEDDIELTQTISLLSGHTYVVGLEAFAEAWAIDQGWARAEAFVDPTFVINSGQANAGSFNLNHITPAGSDVLNIPEPSQYGSIVAVFSLLLIGLRRRG